MTVTREELLGLQMPTRRSTVPHLTAADVWGAFTNGRCEKCGRILVAAVLESEFGKTHVCPEGQI